MFYLNAKLFIAAWVLLLGSSGLAYAETDRRDVVRDSGGQIVHSTNGNCVRTKWLSSHDQCGPYRVVQQTTIQQKVTKPVAVPTQEERTVYFAFDRSVLSPEAVDRLGTLANALRSIQNIKEARIVGYADRIGSNGYNERLSQRRAETVRNYLVAQGYTNARVTETRWVGEMEPSTNCPAEARTPLIACLQRDRRVEVEIDYLPEAQVPQRKE